MINEILASKIFVALLSIALIGGSSYPIYAEHALISITSVDSPTQVKVNERFLVTINVRYELGSPRLVLIGLWDRDAGRWVEQRLTVLSGTGGKEYSFELTAPIVEGVWNLLASIFYREETGRWLQADSKSFTITVIKAAPRNLIEREVNLSRNQSSSIVEFDLAQSIDNTGDGRPDAYIYINVPSGASRMSILMNIEPDDDIDMCLFRPDGSRVRCTFLGRGVSEMIEVNSPEEGRWLLHVYVYSSYGQTAQAKLMIYYKPKEERSIVEAKIEGPERVAINNSFLARITITNKGNNTLNLCIFALGLPAGFQTAIKRFAVQRIDAGENRSFPLIIKAPRYETVGEFEGSITCYEDQAAGETVNGYVKPLTVKVERGNVVNFMVGSIIPLVDVKEVVLIILPSNISFERLLKRDIEGLYFVTIHGEGPAKQLVLQANLLSGEYSVFGFGTLIIAGKEYNAVSYTNINVARDDSYIIRLIPLPEG